MEIFFAYFFANLLKLDTEWINGSPNRQNYNIYKPSSTQSEQKAHVTQFADLKKDLKTLF